MSPSHIESNGARKSSNSPDGSSKFDMFRQLVPIVRDDKITYLNASFAPPSNLIIHEALTKYLSESLYKELPKPAWQAAVEEARKLLGRYINTDQSTIAFTRDTTEGLNNFIRGLRFQPGDNVVILDSEHPNHAYGWMSLREAGLEVRQIPTIPEAEKAGQVTAANAATFAPYVDDRTRAIGISSVMFHSGQWNDVADICAAYRPRGIHVVVDATQQVGFAPIDVKAMGVSAAAFGMHKGLNCPTGLAALYVDTDVIADANPTPPIVGYGAVSNVRADLLVPEDPILYHPTARRYEHLNVSLIAIAAAKAYLTFYLDTMGPREVEEHLFNLGDALRKECKRLGVTVVGPETRKEHAPHLYILDLHGSGWMEHLREMDVIVTPYRLGIRVSFGFYNNVQDVERLSWAIEAGLKKNLPLGRS
ncbi:pyridoxal phosphate-dependent transferase [Ilyonectria sp. MPI-CAGE-AT-0026]|nr:pyridoxal phosphate-dependent transferase [Ilyonectria sp. MPI-CAGE-AT-0026]